MWTASTYCGLKTGYGRRYHWLDLQRLAVSLLRPGQELRAVHYFTARAYGNSDGERRQVIYLNALASHSPKVRLIEGRFQEKQLPPQIMTKGGVLLERPDHWK